MFADRDRGVDWMWRLLGVAFVFAVGVLVGVAVGAGALGAYHGAKDREFWRESDQSSRYVEPTT